MVCVSVWRVVGFVSEPEGGDTALFPAAGPTAWGFIYITPLDTPRGTANARPHRRREILQRSTT